MPTVFKKPYVPNLNILSVKCYCFQLYNYRRVSLVDRKVFYKDFLFLQVRKIKGNIGDM